MPSSHTDNETPKIASGPRGWTPLLLAVPDALILCGGLLFGYVLRSEDRLLPSTPEWETVSVLVLIVYGAALWASGTYRVSPRDMNRSDFLHLGAWLVGGWGAAAALVYSINPASLPPRNVLLAQGLVILLGILGIRAGYRELLTSAPALTGNPAPGESSRRFRLDDLVSRTQAPVDRAGLRNVLSDRAVLVTGAGGSIGVELSRQLLGLQPFRLALVDVSERNLYRLETALRSKPYQGGLEFCIGDVRDGSLMEDLIQRHHPDVVIHAAAYKHVPLMERHPAEAFRNNTQASVQLLKLCEKHEVDRFVFVSTDKAVDPSNVLGATKQLAEWYMHTGPDSPRCTTVRFGNVFGTEGSVVPRFEEKLAAGEPLPVTHPEMERYFMSPEEACGLILHTLLLDTHPTYIFRMGDPIRIQWLAERLIRHWYPHVDPETMIEYVGRRPGEKLSEQLVRDDEAVHSTEHPHIVGLNGPVPYPRAVLDAHLKRLGSVAAPSQESRARLRQLLLETRPGGQRRTNGSASTQVSQDS